MPPMLLHWPMMSEVDASMAVEAEPSHSDRTVSEMEVCMKQRGH